MLEKLQETILGTMMYHPGDIDTAAAILKTSDFHKEMYQDIFDFIIKKQGADYILIAHEFKGKYPIQEILAWEELSQFPSFLKKHCLELKEANRKELLYKLLVESRRDIEGKTSAEIIEHISSKILSLETSKTVEPERAQSLVKSTIKTLEQRYENKGNVTGIPYGWPDLDKHTNGMANGDLIIIAGRPSMGKSAMASNICESVCNAGYSAAMFSLEMGKEQLMERFFASSGNLNFGRIRSGRFDQSDWHKLMAGSTKVHGFNLAIDDTAGITLQDIRYKTRMMQRKHGLSLVIIDYLQLMGIAEKESRVLEVGKVSRGLKQLARELNIPIVLLSQLNRGVDARNDKRPTMSDLRDSGEIEQDADVILFPYRPAAYCQECRDKKDDHSHDTESHQSLAEIIIEKQRNGERNIKVPVVWLGKYQKFVSLDNN